MTRDLPFIDLAAQRRRLGGRDDEAIARVLAHGKFVMGPEVASLEGELAAFTGAGEVVSCSSGTDALVLALMALGVRAGEAVIVPTFTFASTAEAVALLGAVPVFADVDGRSFNVTVDDLDAAARGAAAAGLDLVGVIAVDLFGQPADYAAINDWASSRGSWVIADAAQSFGATRGGSVGTLARVTTTSFFPAKPLGCYGDGGAVFTDDADLAATMRSLRVHGKGTDKYDNVRIGINGRLDTVQAAVLLEKLAIFPDEVDARQRAAAAYCADLAGHVAVPVVDPGATSVWAQYTVRTRDRDAVAGHLGRRGVPTAVYYPRPLHQQTAYASYPRASELTTSEALASEVLSLPMHPYLTDDDRAQVVAAVLESGAVAP